MSYGKHIDPLIYNESTKAFTDFQFIDLALAALDQAGLKVRTVDTIMGLAMQDMLTRRNPGNYGQTTIPAVMPADFAAVETPLPNIPQLADVRAEERQEARVCRPLRVNVHE